MEFKTAYSKNPGCKTDLHGESLTQQNFKRECDINYILKKYQKTGLVEHVSKYKGNYEDLSQPCDYQTAMNLVISAAAAFESLPSSIRKQFDNDPGRFLAFAENPDNLEEMKNLGLAKTPVVPAQPSAESLPAEPAKPETPAG